ncbi:hypothetical protein GA0115240_100424 [Streptomyces sp. DvalAA-14]|uniref:hypothetical protein n=1 Tax=unclassified Streptomyces TaxID=2593676 RepID=UPI00081AFB2A|nr:MULTISPECIES: hypothetical protein [unclassified Streptomyces]MYS18714.1 hypothetical protein [Streptomyces sp. SID4948]SCD28006.1 hypothetical protein GA0115240_100424 [Streptomyces sp. DvalAA-14]
MDNGTVPLHRLTFVDEGQDVLIGRPEIESFALFPPDGAELVRRLQAGDTVEQAGRWYRAAYGEDADLDDVVEALRGLGFVRGEDEGEESANGASAPVRWRRPAAVLLSRPAFLCYFLLAVAAVYLEVRRPGLRPASGHFFVGRSLLLVEAAAYLAELVGLLLHEGFHVLAGRRLGLSSRLSISRRLYFIVFQTTMTGLMGVEPRKRILPFCAGLLADAINYSVMIVIAAVDTRLNGGATFVGHFALLLAYLTLLRMSWQFMVFMETDLYYVFTTLAHCPNLLRLTRQQLRRGAYRLLRRPPATGGELSSTPHELRVVRFYLPVVVIGTAVMIAAAVLFALPVMIEFVIRLTHGITGGGPLDERFWDAAAAGGLVLGQLVIVVVIAIRERRARPPRRAAAGPVDAATASAPAPALAPPAFTDRSDLP